MPAPRDLIRAQSSRRLGGPGPRVERRRMKKSRPIGPFGSAQAQKQYQRTRR